MINISGKWSYSEDFGFGTNIGNVEWTQMDNQINGTIRFHVEMEEESSFVVEQIVEGEVIDNQVKFHAVAFKLISADAEFDYHLDSFEGIYNQQGQIVGSTFDDEGVCGVFVMNRLA